MTPILFMLSADEREQISADQGDDDDDDEVRKLKVCIELKGLRLSKPAAGAASPDCPQIKQERAWPQPRPAAPAQGARERKIRPGEPEDRAAAQRAEINRKWGCEKLLNGRNAPAAAQTTAVSVSSARVTEIYLWLTFHFLVEQADFRGFPRSLRGGGRGNEVEDASSCQGTG